MNCRIHIERIVLDGWSSGSVDREVLAASLHEELEKLAAPTKPDLAIRVPVRAPAARLARDIARSLDSQLGLRKLVTPQTLASPPGESHSQAGRGSKVVK